VRPLFLLLQVGGSGRNHAECARTWGGKLLPPETFTYMTRVVRILAGKLYSRLPRNCGIDMADLVQAGSVGLLQAARTYEPEKGTPLAGYAKFRIRGEMLDAVRKNAENARLCVSSMANGAETKGVEDHGSAKRDLSPQSSLLRSERNALIRAEMSRLPGKYRRVIKLRYLDGLTHREIGGILNVNESRACQIHHDALSRLKQGLSRRGLHDFSPL